MCNLQFWLQYHLIAPFWNFWLQWLNYRLLGFRLSESECSLHIIPVIDQVIKVRILVSMFP